MNRPNYLLGAPDHRVAGMPGTVVLFGATTSRSAGRDVVADRRRVFGASECSGSGCGGSCGCDDGGGGKGCGCDGRTSLSSAMALPAMGWMLANGMLTRGWEKEGHVLTPAGMGYHLRNATEAARQRTSRGGDRHYRKACRDATGAVGPCDETSSSSSTTGGSTSGATVPDSSSWGSACTGDVTSSPDLSVAYGWSCSSTANAKFVFNGDGRCDDTINAEMLIGDVLCFLRDNLDIALWAVESAYADTAEGPDFWKWAVNAQISNKNTIKYGCVDSDTDGKATCGDPEGTDAYITNAETNSSSWLWMKSWTVTFCFDSGSDSKAAQLLWQCGDSAERLLGTIVLAARLLHELLHVCGDSHPSDDPSVACDRIRETQNTFLWAALSRYPSTATTACAAASSDLFAVDASSGGVVPAPFLILDEGAPSLSSSAACTPSCNTTTGGGGGGGGGGAHSRPTSAAAA